ncbi:hypothetical protein ACEV7Y_17475 [Vibrio parahaemolyticus]|uniref:hypothetical protein n=1 Tax=Vibrio alginolyticus TaxID=663 RepID=UPI00215FC1D1|nr:hypothetical protein [Vibrio alginolyticus]MCS0074466.1 hypothetical protein [Vibrio alginolyticus]HCG8320744.1 hypothetical protein [Vibrio parahaemolyticus]
MSNLAYACAELSKFSAPSMDNAIVDFPDFDRGDCLLTDIPDSPDLDYVYSPQKTHTDAQSIVQEKSSIELEEEFYCVIYRVDRASQQISARVYEPKVNVEVMDIDAPFSNFDKEDQNLIKENAVFYWRIGSETTYRKNKRAKISASTKNFSSFTMRRLYTSKRFHQEKINEQIKNFDSVFSD